MSSSPPVGSTSKSLPSTPPGRGLNSSCAEATAVANAVSSGVRKLDTVAVACIDAADIEGAYPCGRCRQIMWEFGVERVIVTTGSGEVREHYLAELLPHGFKL